MNPIIDVQGVSVDYGAAPIIEKVSFRVEEGDIAILVGPNGSGKSTLLRAILGMIPFEGEVLVVGKKVRDSLGDIGYVPQYFEFDRTFPITVREFLMMFADDVRKATKALAEVDMLASENKLLGSLSGGQLQRVLIARAILSVPKLLILDEPTSSIDVEGVKSFIEIIKHMNTEHGVSVLIVSHEINLVYDIATRVVCLNKGIVCFGEPKEVLTPEALTDLYGSQVHHHVH